MNKTIISLLIISLLLSSCCSAFLDPVEKVSVSAEQEGADVFIDGYECGKVPLIAELDKKRNHKIVVSKPGYTPQEALIQSKHTMRSAYNATTPLSGAAIGSIIGAISSSSASGYIAPMCFLGAYAGAIVGVGVGLVGFAVDCLSRADCTLNTDNVHFQLVKEATP